MSDNAFALLVSGIVASAFLAVGLRWLTEKLKP